MAYNQLMTANTNSHLEKLLKKFFGYSSFRPGQLEIIDSVLSGCDTLAVMPTGGGKSLCYQIPALVFSGLTVVVSPLIALMQDQVSQLDNVGIPSLFLNSSLDWDEYTSNMAQIRSGEIKLLYCAPETLVTERMRNLLSSVKVSCLTIDEAHCISEWGHDFRPEYRCIADVREIFPDAVCLALTATATETVRKDIRTSLKLGQFPGTGSPAERQVSKNAEKSAQNASGSARERQLSQNTAGTANDSQTSQSPRFNEFVSSFDRPNIFLEVQSKAGSARIKAKKGGMSITRADELTLDFIRTHPEESGIVYCFSRKKVDELTSLLNLSGISALPYHAGLSDEERVRNQMKFVRDEVSVIVATVAFGMGINKPNVRFIIHYDLPKSLEQYYQEIGRAGRDGEPAHALLLYSYGDTRKIQFFMQEKTGKELAAAEKQLKDMVDYAECTSCRRTKLLEHFGEKASGTRRTSGNACCDICSGDNSPVKIDVTIPVQKILSCIIRTGERFGTSYIVDVLTGSRQQRIIDNGHSSLSVWGIGKEYARNDWFELTRLLVSAGYLNKSEDYQVLSLTQTARQALSVRSKIMLPFMPSGKTSLSAKDAQSAAGTKSTGNAKASYGAFSVIQPSDKKAMLIFEELRQGRKVLAEKADVPPFVIFGDRTLTDIAVKKPTTKEELTDIFGIGETKAARYGDFIIKTVKSCL